MNVIQRPDAQEFCATMKDYIIDTDNTITFAIQYGGKTILEEEYTPDKSFQVRIRKLGKFCENALWGVWCAGESSWQADAAGTFTFLINGIQDAQSYVMFSRLQTKKTAASPGWLSEVREKVTRTNGFEYVSAVFDTAKKAIVTIRTDSGITMSADLYTHSGEKGIVTLDVSPAVIFALFPTLTVSDIVSYSIIRDSDVMKFFVDHTVYPEMFVFRYKNVYDLPETLTTVGLLSVKPANESDNAQMYGVERVFGLKVTDEYTANSGTIFLPSDYKLWHNMMNTQEAQVYYEGSWYPIIIGKPNYEREYRKGSLKNVEFSFKMADPDQNNLIDL